MDHLTVSLCFICQKYSLVDVILSKAQYSSGSVIVRLYIQFFATLQTLGKSFTQFYPCHQGQSDNDIQN